MIYPLLILVKERLGPAISIMQDADKDEEEDNVHLQLKSFTNNGRMGVCVCALAHVCLFVYTLKSILLTIILNKNINK